MYRFLDSLVDSSYLLNEPKVALQPIFSKCKLNRVLGVFIRPEVLCSSEVDDLHGPLEIPKHEISEAKKPFRSDAL